MATATVYIKGTIGSESLFEDDPKAVNTTLSDIVTQVEAQKPFDDIQIFIGESPGGVIQEGDQSIDYLKSFDKPINTKTFGPIASFATKFFVTGGAREISDTHGFFVHNPLNIHIGDANQHEKNVEFLREEENRMREFFATETGVSEEAVKALFDFETDVPPQNLKDMGFATDVVKTDPKQDAEHSQKADEVLNKKNRAAAIIDYQKINKMAQTKDKDTSSAFSKFMASIDAAIKKIDQKVEALQKEEPVNLEREIEGGGTLFIEVDEGEPWVGAQARLVDDEGEQSMPEDGEITLNDGTVVAVSGGIVETVTEPSEEETNQIEQLAKSVEEIANRLKEQPTAQDIKDTVLKELVPGHVPQATNSFSSSTKASVTRPKKEEIDKIKQEQAAKNKAIYNQ